MTLEAELVVWHCLKAGMFFSRGLEVGCGFCITWQKICSLNSAAGKVELLSRVHSASLSFFYVSFPSLSRDESPGLHGIFKSPMLIYTCAIGS